MAQREEGWPLGLRLNARLGLVGRSRDFNGSISFSTLVTGSPTSFTGSSSDLDTESTGSFFHDKSITLGSLLGVSSILELSRRSSMGRVSAETLRNHKNYKSKPWLFSLCSRLTTDAVNPNNHPSLGHFLQAERRAANIHRRNMSPTTTTLYGPNDFSPVLPSSNMNSFFISGQVAAESRPSFVEDAGRSSTSNLLENGNRCGNPLLFSCLCGQLIE